MEKWKEKCFEFEMKYTFDIVKSRI